MKTIVFDVDLIQNIKYDPSFFYDIKTSLKQINNSCLPDSIVSFILKLKPFLD